MLALTIALTGTAYAATLPKGSVGTKQLKKGAVSANKLKRNAVTSAKVKNRSLLARDFKAGQLPRGPKGEAGASALNPVPSGKTIRGAVGGDFHAYDALGRDFGAVVSLPIPAANGLSDRDVFVNVAGWKNDGGQTAPTTTDTDPGCNGSPANPTAPPGKVCIYVSVADNAFNLGGCSIVQGAAASPYGFMLRWESQKDGDTLAHGTWAYTAP